jgi:hypothetical protein
MLAKTGELQCLPERWIPACAGKARSAQKFTIAFPLAQLDYTLEGGDPCFRHSELIKQVQRLGEGLLARAAGTMDPRPAPGR